MKHYDTVEYAQSRLVDTIVRLGNKPILVRAVGGNNRNIIVHYEEVLTTVGGMKEVALTELNLDPVPLGYVNFDGLAHYLTRAPMRRDWRQGLRMLNIMVPNGGQPRAIPYRTIANTIIGKYPTFNSALDKLNKTTNSSRALAFCRDFAMTREKLCYKGVFDVGSVNMDNGNIEINRKFDWVREALEQNMEKAA